MPTPPWRPERKPKAARKLPLTREAIVDVGLALVDEDGLSGLSMRRVAQRLDTGAASLYAHVVNKEELVELMLDRVAGEMDLSDPASPERWEDQVRSIARQTRDIYGRHADLALAFLGKVPLHENALRSSEYLLSVMKTGGLSDHTAAWGVDLLALFVTSQAAERGMRGMWQRQRGESGAEYFEQLAAFFEQLPAERFPTLVALLPALMSGDEEDRFEFGLDVLISGMKAYDRRHREA